MKGRKTSFTHIRQILSTTDGEIPPRKENEVKRLKLFVPVFLVTVFCAIPTNADRAKLNTSLRFLKHMREQVAAEPKIKGPELTAARADNVVATVKFDHVLSDAEIEEYTRLGVSFYDINGTIARTGVIYPVKVPWSMLDVIAGRKELLRLEGSWKPAVYPLLDVSAPEVKADTTWRHTDPLGNPLTGQGTIIADFDTGIDVFHPSFFLADGDTVDWIDVDGFGTFDPGYDAVDLNDNDVADAGELLDYFDGWIYDPALVWGPSSPNNQGNGYQTYWDWLFNDANGNGSREFGTSAGYTESDPTFGEPLFIPLDDNGNGELDVGEKLVTLHTSKILATLNGSAIERVRDTDLIDSDPDAHGHGTAVSGILAGGTVDQHIFTGIAPEAEILMGYFFSGNPISLLIPWARDRGANAMLYEFGGFVWEYLDGSSLEEELISDENDSILQITPSGNLGRGNKHAIAPVPGSGSVMLRISVPTYGGESILHFYNTTLWRTTEGDLTFRLRSPLGSEIILEGSVSSVDGYYVWFDKSTSTRGTCAFSLYVSNDLNPHCLGTWEFGVDNNTASEIEIISNVADHLSSWAGGAEWLDYATDQNNVTWPATADSAFVNGSYSTRGFEGYGGVGGGTIPPGEISAFSGRGVRIDGKHLLDICSPGNYDVYSTRTHQNGAGYPLGSYRQFSGTSAAGPHVAAAVALVQQAFPAATMEEVAEKLTSNAATDEYTGDVYNDTWGYGKLCILGAVGITTDVEEMAMGAKPPRLLLDQNYPNPFNPTTWIPFYLPKDGEVSIRIYNVRGELVKVLKEKWMSRGAHSVHWNGDDRNNYQVASGLYFCTLRFGGEVQSRKLVLLR